MNLSTSLGFYFYVGWREINGLYREILGKDVSPQQLWVLELCDANDDLCMHDVAEKMCLDASAISTLVSRMEKNELLRRTHQTQDRRAVNVNITEKGKSLLQRIQGKLPELEHRIHANIQPQDSEAVQRVVSKLKENAARGE